MYKPQQPKLELTAEARGGVAYISISGDIYSWGEASSGELEKKIKEFTTKGISKAIVRIHTKGGDVFEATEIHNLLEDAFDTIEVNAGALVASAGTYFLTKYKSTAKPNSMFMIHKPSGGVHGNEDDVESRLKLLKQITNDYRTSYANKMSITEEAVNALWNKGDHWMTAQEALKAGLIDAIEGKKVTISPEAYLDLVACGAPNAEHYKPKPNKRDMNIELLAAQLGLPATATEAEVTAKIEALKKAETDLATAKAEKQTAAVTAQAEAVKKMLDEAEQKKQITAAQRPHYEQLATANFESCKAVLEAIPEGGSGVSAQLDKGKGPAAQGEHDFAYYQQHPQAWEELEANEPEKAKALAEAHYSEID